METYVALLRGINVGGARKVAMADLRDVFVRLGHTDVQTYVQSGNAVFRGDGPAATVRAGIEGAIAEHLDVGVTVILRSADELAAIVAGNPFVGRGADPKALHATLLAEPPADDRAREVTALGVGRDELEVAGTTLYLHLPDGYGRTKLNNAFFERRLGVTATTRNWKTMTALAGLATA